MEIIKVLRGRRKTSLKLRNDPYKFIEFVLISYHASKKSSDYLKI
jgi:hypothetical protein